MQQTSNSTTTTIRDIASLKKEEEQQNQLNPYMMFKYSIRSELTRKYYERRLRRFFDFIQFEEDIEKLGIAKVLSSFADEHGIALD
jgi:hypothetical protein